MRDPVERYLEDVLCHADLAKDDERDVRGELAEHLHSLVAESGLSNPTEVYAMLNEKFGNARRVGRGIAAARGRVRTYLKKLRRRLPLQVGVALVLAFAVRFAVAQAFYVPGDGGSPMVPRGSRVLVYKLASSFNPGDVIVYRYGDSEFRLGIIDRQTSDDHWLVEKDHGTLKAEVSRDKIVGRVFLNTR